MDALNDISKLILEDKDYVAVPRYGSSLKRLMERYPDGVPSRATAAKALMMSEEDFNALVDGAIAKLRDFF